MSLHDANATDPPVATLQRPPHGKPVRDVEERAMTVNVTNASAVLSRVSAIPSALVVISIIAVLLLGGVAAQAQSESGAVSNLRLSSPNAGELVIAWDAPGEAPTDYRVIWAPVGEDYLSYRSDNTSSKGNAYPTAAAHTVSGLASGTEYKARVRARYRDGDHTDTPWSGPWSNEATITISPSAERSDARQAPGSYYPRNLTATAVADGVKLNWDPPLTDADAVQGYQILRKTDGEEYLRVYVENTGSKDTTFTDYAAANRGNTYTYQLMAVRSVPGPVSRIVSVTIPGACPISGGSPVDVTVSEVPIVVTSTTADYFVLYVLQSVRGKIVELPVLAKRGEAGTTTLEDNLAALPAGSYKVKKYPVNNPADVDGDCIDDVTELNDPRFKNPVNPAAGHQQTNGAVSIADHATFEALSYKGDDVLIDQHLKDLEYVKFHIVNPTSDHPSVYFMNTVSHREHGTFLNALALPESDHTMRGEIIYHPNVTAPDGSLGVYRYEFQPRDNYSFDAVAFSSSCWLPACRR